ncbi:hypothetical protein B8A39_09410 [Dolosigranulum pigrum]|jgi:hypothetical protein|uniref:hypothetical protein n=1 Tax=Dolosigranulum pigrum TaxID=29394 RepID=UPI000DBF8DFD|nr:hypothetical protein [Dolosigranulum pigrum]QTJ33067.1 hypothetical protein FE321_05390 [Dolosigranulum pigrum]RAN50606.1 hypothetical protein B8A39_09410 [Dolosigranulum pigrum]
MTNIVELIRTIDELHIYFNKEVCKDLPSGINFGKKQVNHLFENKNFKNTFFDHLDKYYTRLRKYTREDKFINIDRDFRIKERESLVYKLEKYYQGSEKGKIPIQKCINDLLGFRIITDTNLMNSKEFKEICEQLKKEKVIYFYYVRQDGDYRGIHLYFKGKSNNYLPWELQIWYNEHEDANRRSHATHKQYYLK